MTREAALSLVRSMTSNENLVNHMLAVEAVMAFYAKHFDQDENSWRLAGLLHDADWQSYPEDHPQIILQKLRTIVLNDDSLTAIMEAINGHGGKGQILRRSLMAKALFAADELAGFIIACALVRPGKLEDLNVGSVKKKLKDKTFARNINRREIEQGAEEIGFKLDDHIANTIEALRGAAGEIGL